MPWKHCSGNTHPTTFTDLPTAEAACAKMGGACGGVYDNGCRFAVHQDRNLEQVHVRDWMWI